MLSCLANYWGLMCFSSFSSSFSAWRTTSKRNLNRVCEVISRPWLSVEIAGQQLVALRKINLQKNIWWEEIKAHSGQTHAETHDRLHMCCSVLYCAATYTHYISNDVRGFIYRHNFSLVTWMLFLLAASRPLSRLPYYYINSNVFFFPQWQHLEWQE